MKIEDAIEIDEINLDSIEKGTISRMKLGMVQNALGDLWQIPLVIIKGQEDGPVLGITAAIHGNELNGISIIHKLIDHIDPKELKGTVVAAPVMNIPGFLNGEREYLDGKDLNRMFPGKENGTESQTYAWIIHEKILKKINYLIDLHTASFGRINSLYVRSDMTDPFVAKMSRLQEPQLIVNVEGEVGTFRKAAQDLGIPAITVEVGDPQVFQKKHIRPSTFGVVNVMNELGMINAEDEEIDEPDFICKRSFWIHAENGGVLEVFPKLASKVLKGDLIAAVRNIYGEVVEQIYAPEDGVVVGKSTNPVCHTGSRVLHLGVIWEDYQFS
jgi:predicted deacylase